MRENLYLESVNVVEVLTNSLHLFMEDSEISVGFTNMLDHSEVKEEVA